MASLARHAGALPGKALRAARMLGLYRSWPLAYRNRLARGPRAGEAVYELRNGLTLAMDAGAADVRVLNEVWLDRVYEPTPAFRPRPGWTVADLGAHKGGYSLLAAAAGARVLAVEPSPANLPQLRRNVEASGLAVEVLPCAAGAERGSGVLAFAAGAAHRGTLVLERGYESREVVETITLADVVERAGGSLDLVKMDIEGAEVEVLEAAPPETLARIGRLVVECHRRGGRATDDVGADLARLLESHGFACTYDHRRQLLAAERAGS